MDFRSFGGENYTITSRQAVIREINLISIHLQFEILNLLESIDMQKLVVTVYNLSSILRDVGNQTVGLEFSEVGYAACMKITNVRIHDAHTALIIELYNILILPIIILLHTHENKHTSYAVNFISRQ